MCDKLELNADNKNMKYEKLESMCSVHNIFDH